MRVIRRLNTQKASAGRKTCPDFFELDNGDFAFIGEDITNQADTVLLPDAGVNSHERLIRVPRAIITSAKHNIPDA